MFTPGSLSSASAEYSVVVLPEPVGPVTYTIPYGCSIISRIMASTDGSVTSLSRPSVVFDLSRIRMQTFSPHLPGTVDTRKSIGLLSSVTLRSEEHTSELQSLRHLVCRLL